MKSGIQRLYYSITEVSKIIGEEQHVLRYWEREFSQLRPQKNRAGNRVYAEKDLDVLKVIKRLLRDERYTVAGAKEHLRLHGVQEELDKDTRISEASKTEAPAKAAAMDGSSREKEIREIRDEIKEIADDIRRRMSNS